MDRPRPISADGMEGVDVDPNASHFLADPVIEDMKEFDLLFQVRVGQTVTALVTMKMTVTMTMT